MQAWLDSAGLQLWKELLAPFNILPFPMGNAGDAMGGWFDIEIKKVDNFKGLNIRMSDLCSKVYRKLGANECPMSAGKALDAFKRKEINVIICQGPYNDQYHHFYQEGPKYYYYPGWQEPGGVISIIINKKAWNDLPNVLQQEIEIVSKNTSQFIINQFANMNVRALVELVGKEKVILKEFPSEVLKQLEKISDEILEEEAAKSQRFKKVYEAFKKFKKDNPQFGWKGKNKEGEKVRK